MGALLSYLQGKHAAKGALLTSVFEDEQAKFDETYARVLEETGSEQMALLAANGAVRRLRRGLPVKADRVGDEVLVSGWGILFADAYTKDLHGEYFPRDGEFFLDYYKDAPLFFEHSADNRYKWVPVGVRVGYAVYDHGIWFTHRLFNDHPMYEKTAALVKAGALSYSSDSVAHVVMRGETDDGGLKVWPLIGFSLVRNPAEPGLGNVIAEGASE